MEQSTSKIFVGYPFVLRQAWCTPATVDQLFTWRLFTENLSVATTSQHSGDQQVLRHRDEADFIVEGGSPCGISMRIRAKSCLWLGAFPVRKFANLRCFDDFLLGGAPKRLVDVSLLVGNSNLLLNMNESVSEDRGSEQLYTSRETVYRRLPSQHSNYNQYRHRHERFISLGSRGESIVVTSAARSSSQEAV
jgi:hypothetical protein